MDSRNKVSTATPTSQCLARWGLQHIITIIYLVTMMLCWMLRVIMTLWSALMTYIAVPFHFNQAKVLHAALVRSLLGQLP